jgi:hypothetical protein
MGIEKQDANSQQTVFLRWLERGLKPRDYVLACKAVPQCFRLLANDFRRSAKNLSLDIYFSTFCARRRACFTSVTKGGDSNVEKDTNHIRTAKHRKEIDND